MQREPGQGWGGGRAQKDKKNRACLQGHCMLSGGEVKGVGERFRIKWVMPSRSSKKT